MSLILSLQRAHLNILFFLFYPFDPSSKVRFISSAGKGKVTFFAVPNTRTFSFYFFMVAPRTIVVFFLILFDLFDRPSYFYTVARAKSSSASYLFLFSHNYAPFSVWLCSIYLYFPLFDKLYHFLS